MKNFDNKSGFTLIEMIMVISVIAILATIAYASFGSAREQARDKVRMSSLKELQLALELYKQVNGNYPPRGCGITSGWTGPGPFVAAPWGSTCDVYISGLAPDFIAELPRDPKSENIDNLGFIYWTEEPARSKYKVIILGSVETSLVTAYDHEFARCPRNCGTSWCPAGGPPTNDYSVYSANAECD